MQKKSIPRAIFASKIVISLLAIALILFSSPCHADKQKDSTPAAKQRFNNIEYWVKIFEDPERDKWQKPEEVVKQMNLKPGDTVADIGAGTGYFTRRFAVAVSPGGKAIGLDIETSMVEYMKEDAENLRLTNYLSRVVKPDDPELPPMSVDVIFLCNTYHHIEKRIEYFKNVAKSLKPSGRIVIVDFYKDIEFGPPRDHKLSKEIVLKEMKQAGYRLKKDMKFLPYQYYIEFAL